MGAAYRSDAQTRIRVPVRRQSSCRGSTPTPLGRNKADRRRPTSTASTLTPPPRAVARRLGSSTRGSWSWQRPSSGRSADRRAFHRGVDRPGSSRPGAHRQTSARPSRHAGQPRRGCRGCRRSRSRRRRGRTHRVRPRRYPQGPLSLSPRPTRDRRQGRSCPSRRLPDRYWAGTFRRRCAACQSSGRRRDPRHPTRERTLTYSARAAARDCHAAAGRAARHLPAMRPPAQPVPIAREATLPAVRPFTRSADGELVDMRLCCRALVAVEVQRRHAAAFVDGEHLENVISTRHFRKLSVGDR